MKNFWSILIAYLAVWAVFFGYYVSVGRRLARLQDQVERLRHLLEK